MNNIGFNAAELNSSIYVQSVETLAATIAASYDVSATLSSIKNLSSSVESTTTVVASAEIIQPIPSVQASIEYSTTVTASALSDLNAKCQVLQRTVITAEIGYKSANLWDTKQGVAKGYMKFTPMQDGEPFLEEQHLESTYGIVKPEATASALLEESKVNVSFQLPFGFAGNGYAPIHSRVGFVGYFTVAPKADSVGKLYTAKVENKLTYVRPIATASPMINSTPAMTAASGYTFPWGVRNPSDEEIITVILEARKRRVLTQNKTNGITRA